MSWPREGTGNAVWYQRCGWLERKSGCGKGFLGGIRRKKLMKEPPDAGKGRGGETRCDLKKLLWVGIGHAGTRFSEDVAEV